MNVSQRSDGRWLVTDADGNTISDHPTNSQAWRAADRATNEPINKREAVADFVFGKMAAGEAVRSPNEVKRVKKSRRPG